MNRSDGHWRWLIAFIAVLYVALRVWNLNDSCLWFDEIFSVHAAEHDWANLFWFVAQDLIHPPLFYVLLKIWISIGGESPIWLRFFPVFFATLAVPPFLLLCRQLKFPPATVAAALFFFAVNGALIKYAQEVRMYSVMVCFALVSFWLCARFLDTNKNFVFLVAVNLALVYTHYFGWFVIAAETAAVLILARGKFKQICLMILLVAGGFAPWLYAVWQASKINRDVGQNIGWMTKPNLTHILRFAFDLFEPIRFEQSTKDAAAILLITLPLIAVALIAAGFCAANWRTDTEPEKRTIILLSIFAFAPSLMAFAASWLLPYSIWGTRHLIVAFAPFLMLLALVFSRIKLPPLRRAAFGAVFLLCAAAFGLQAARGEPRYIWCAWENLAASLDAKQPVKIYAFEDLVAYHFWFALRETPAPFEIVKLNGIEGLKEDRAYFLPRGFDGVQTAYEFTGERFFIAYRDKIFNERAAPLANLTARGYIVGEPRVYEAQGLKAFLVEVKKQN